MESAGDSWPRRPPAVMHFSDSRVQVVLVLLYSSFIIASFFGGKLQNPLPPPVINNSSSSLFLYVEWQFDMQVQNGIVKDLFIGLSLSDRFASVLAHKSGATYNRFSHKFNSSVNLTLSLQLLPSQSKFRTECNEICSKLPSHELFQLNTSRLAFFDHPWLQNASNCPHLSLTIDLPWQWWFDKDIASAARNGGFQVETRQKSWGHEPIRVTIFILCVIICLDLIAHSVLARRGEFRVPLGMRAVAFALSGLVCFINPFNFKPFSSILSDSHSRWLVPLGGSLTLAGLSYFPTEVHRDLTEMDQRECIARWPVRTRRFTLVEISFKIGLALLNFASTLYFNIKVVSAVNEADGGPVKLATSEDWISWTFMDYFLFGFSMIPPVAFTCLFFRGLSSLTKRLKAYPYSICRTHYILVSCAALFSSVAAFSIFFLLIRQIFGFSQVGPWSHLNNWMCMSLLPFPADIFAPEQIIACLAVFTAIAGLGGNPRSIAGLGSSPLSSSLISERAGQAFLVESSATALINPSVVPTVPYTNAGAGGSPVFAAPGITLLTVRLLCHCSHVTYKTKRGGELTKEHLWTGLPCEEDLDYSSLVLHQIIRREGPEDHDVLAFVASIECSSGRIAIVSFRGTATNKNIRTDFDYQMEPIKLPHLGNASEWSNTYVHRGFQTNLLSVYSELCDAIREIEFCSIWFTGHSMGGAMATLLAAEFLVSSPGLHVGCCTFGSPRVVDKQFATLFRTSSISSMRVVLERDPLTKQPPRYCTNQYCFKNRVYKHTHGLIRVSSLGHLVSNPNFLERQLRRILHYTHLLTTLKKFCCCRTAKNHKIRGYVASLREAQVLEDSRGHDIRAASAELDTFES